MANDANEERLSALKEAVRASFPIVPPPVRENIAPCTRVKCEECLAIRTAFDGKTWNSLQPDEIKARFDSLPMLSPEAFHYYFPAYLLHALDNFNSDSLVWQFTMFAVAPDEDETGYHDWWRERLREFTPEQFKLLERFLDLIGQDEELSQYTPFAGAKERLYSYYESGEPEK